MTVRVAITPVPRDVPTGYGGDRADTVAQGAIRGLVRAGAVPMIAPVVPAGLAAAQLAHVDALVLSGGQDLDLPSGGPSDYRWVDPARDEHELALWGEAARRGLPVLGICRGMQLVNVARGGTLRAQVDGHDAGAAHLRERHRVEVSGPLLRELLGAGRVDVNTIHHQALGAIGDGLTVAASAADGCVEAVESAPGSPWFVGVQWHPELLADEPAGEGLFTGLVAAGRLHGA